MAKPIRFPLERTSAHKANRVTRLVDLLTRSKMIDRGIYLRIDRALAHADKIATHARRKTSPGFRRDQVSPLRAVALFAALFFLVPFDSAAVAHADEIKTLTWSVPFARIDGTALTPAELIKYDLGCAASATATPTVFTSWAVVDPAVTTRGISFPPGEHFCSLRVYADEPLEPSDWSNQVFFSILKSRPNAPADLSVL